MTITLDEQNHKADWIVNIFICEHACSTEAVAVHAATPSLFRGDILLQALLVDLSRVSDLRVTVLRDPAGRLSDIPPSTTVVPLDTHASAATIVRTVEACIANAEAVWPLTSESNGLLEAISKKVLKHDKILLGSSPDAIHLGGSKYRTSQALRTAGIAVVPSWRVQAQLPTDLDALVVKPDDGAGCSDTHIFSHLQAAREWIASQVTGDYILQPYVSGRPCTLSLLCGNDQVFLLGCNDQRVAVSDNQFHYLGSTVNSIDDADGTLQRLAQRVVNAIPGLWGYVGIDLIMTDNGPVVLGVNPRMTMSHAGLHASLGQNPATMLFDMLRSGFCAIPSAHTSRQISVDLNAYLTPEKAVAPLVR